MKHLRAPKTEKGKHQCRARHPRPGNGDKRWEGVGPKRMDRAGAAGLSAADDMLCFTAKTNNMKKTKIKLLEAVALIEDLPERNLRAGEVGTVVELLGPGAYEVEFCDDHGETYAECALRGDQFIPLHTRGRALATPLVES
jgi:hypothetical protein